MSIPIPQVHSNTDRPSPSVNMRRPTKAKAKASDFDHIPIKSEAGESSTLSKEAKQQYLINEIKKLVGECEDFIGLVPGPGGVPEVVVSPNLKSERFKIIGEAHTTFSEYLSMHRPTNSCGLLTHCVKPSTQEPSVNSQAPAGPSGSISIPIQRPLKRHRTRTATTASRSASNPRSRHGVTGMKVLESSASQIRVDDDEQLTDWYKNAFLRLQQVACRLVAKVWIKKIHPKKQSTHPYNGQMPRNAPRDPDRTRPPWWPTDVKHREPDHIGRDERTRLLVHLIKHTPQPLITNPLADPSNQQYVFARELLDCLVPKRGEKEFTEERWETIQQIINAREMQERYAQGEIDGDTLIFLRDYKDDDGSRLRAIDSDDDDPEIDDVGQCTPSEGSELAGDDVDPTTGSSSQTSPMNQTHPDLPLTMTRARGSRESLVFPGRRIATCRSRPSFNGGQRAATSALQAEPIFASEMTRGRRSTVPHLETGMLPRVGIHQQLTHNPYGRLETLSGTTDMIHNAGYSANLDLASWTGIMPDLGPEPSAEMFGMPPTMTPTNMKYSYFGHELGMSGEVQNGMEHPLVSSAPYLVDNTHPNLALRGTKSQHSAMMATQDMQMEMMNSHFY